MENEQVTPPGDQANQNTDQNQESLGWRAALSDQWKNHEFVKDTTKPTDFVEKAWKIKTELDSVKPKLESAIFKPDEKATSEQWDAYYKALGKPEKHTDYEIPVTEGIQRDPKFIEWMQKTFHEIGMPKDMAPKIAAKYDAFALAMEKANNDAVVKAKADAEAATKKELGAEYPVAVELTTRMLTKYMKDKPEEKAFFDETGLGNHPTLIRMIFDLAKKTGEDVGIASATPKGDQQPLGFNYNKSPQPPKK